MQAGDIAALDRFAREHGARLLAVARRACRSRDDAEDAVQQALVHASTSMRGNARAKAAARAVHRRVVSAVQAHA
jgi:DNA-directed RNA polymerase specialized sigma24 family protein